MIREILNFLRTIQTHKEKCDLRNIFGKI